VADDVADDEHRRPAGLQERVVPVAAHPGGLCGGHVPDGDLGVVGLRWIGEQAALQALGQLLLGAVEAGVVQRQARPVGDVLRRGQVTLPAECVVARVERQQAEHPPPPAQGQDRRGPGGEHLQQVGRLGGPQHLDERRQFLADRHTAVQRPGQRRGRRDAVQPERGVAVEHRSHRRVDVPGADVARPAVGVDDGDDAELGERRDDEPRDVRGGRRRVQGAG
jgi:hypothetical protein